MELELSDQDRAAWRTLVEGYKALGDAWSAFRTADVNRVTLLRIALRGTQVTWPAHGDLDRACAAFVASSVEPAELQELLPELVFLSLDHGYALRARELTGSLPRESVLARIEAIAEPYLRDGTDDEYRRLLELYATLDRGLTQRLARRAAEHSDHHIREAGEEYLSLQSDATS